VAVVSVPVFTLAFGEPAEIVVFTCLLCLLIVYKHKANIRRLANGEEKRISFFKKK